MKSSREPAREVRDIIQFALVIIIFFSGLMYYASKATGATEIQAADISLIWGIGVAFHIVNYFLIGILAERIGPNWLRWLRYSIVAGVLAFIYPIIIAAAYSNAHLGSFATRVFFGSFFAAFYMPIATLVLMIIGAYWVMIKEIIHGIKELMRHKR